MLYCAYFGFNQVNEWSNCFCNFENVLHFPNLLKNACALGSSWECEEKTRMSNKWNAKIKQSFLLHLVASCTSSVYFWFLIRLVSQFRTNTSAYMLHSKHKNIKLFGSFPLCASREKNADQYYHVVLGHILYNVCISNWGGQFQ